MTERLIVWKSLLGGLGFEDRGGHESRHASVRRLIEMADAEHDLPRFGETVICTADRPADGALCFTGPRAVPDFLFDAWPEVGIDDYEQVCAEIAMAGWMEAERSVVGWIGNTDTNPVRRHLLDMAGRSRMIDARHAPWPPDGSERLTLMEQVREWALLLDVEGNGWSARLKLLLHSGRPVLVADRPWREWWFDGFRAWEHYIPVARDLSDLEERARWAIWNPEKAQRIGSAGQVFAQQVLTRRQALERWAEILGGGG